MRKTTKNGRRIGVVLLALAMVLALVPLIGGTAADNAAAFERELQQAREVYFNSVAPAAQGLVPISIDDSDVIYEHLPVLDHVPSVQQEDYGEVRHPGPFDVGDTRLFYVRLLFGNTLPETHVMGRLIAQTEHTNVWVLDDDSYHYSNIPAKTVRQVGGYNVPACGSDCHLKDLETNPKIAQNLGNAFDKIYKRMTADFGPHANQSFDRGNDGKVNFVLYDISGVNFPGGSFTAGFYWPTDLSSSGSNNNLDMMHVDCTQRWDSLNASDGSADRLSLYGTLAHEFQHFLFYHTLNTQDPLWFNESLSELAGTYYTLEGAEVASYASRMSYAADNGNYSLTTWNSLQSYAKVKVFSMQNYKRFPNYARNLYTYFKANQLNGTLAHVSNGLTAATGFTMEQHMIFFGESMAADGGRVHYQDNTERQTIKLHTDTYEENNLWAVRAASIGQANNPTTGVRLKSGSWYTVGDLSITSLSSGTSTVALPNTYQEKIYRLSGETTGAPILNITINNETAPSTTRYYIATMNAANTAGNTYAFGGTGATVYELKADGSSNRINTNGRPTYLSITTTSAAASGRSVTYSWAAPAANELVGAVTLSPPRPVLGGTVTATVAPTVSDAQYLWYIGDDPAPAPNTGASYSIPDNGSCAGKVLTVKVTSPSKNGNALFGSTAVIAKKTAAAPSKPIVSAVTPTTVTLEVLAPDAGKYEYSQGGVIWQESPVFTRLLPDTDYNFYRRLKATDDTATSAASPASEARTPAGGWGIALSPGATSFAAATYGGYTAPGAITVTVNNTGTLETGALTVEITDTAKFSLSKTNIGSIAADGSDSFTVSAATGLDAGTYTATVTVDGGEVEAQSFGVSFTVNKRVLTVTAATVTPKTYDTNTSATITGLSFGNLYGGQTLALTTDYTIAGAAYNSADAGPGKTVSGTAALQGNSKTSNYQLAAGGAFSGLAAPDIAKAPGSFDTPGALSAVYSTTLTLANVTPPSGYSWDVPTTPLSGVGSGSYPATRDQGANYSTTTGFITVNVTAAAGEFGNPGPLSSVYTTTLTLANVTPPSGYSWDVPTTPLSGVGSGSYPATRDQGPNYTATTGNITVTVTAAAGSFDNPGPLSAVYTPTLTLANVTLPGGYTWDAPATPLSGVGSGSYPATRDQGANYTATTGVITVNVTAAAGSFDNPGPLNAVFSPALILANVTLPGGYTWDVPGTALSAGSGSYPATRSQGPNYAVTTGNITVNVDKAAAAGVPQVLGVPVDIAASYPFDLATLLPVSAAVMGNVSYSIGAASDPNSVLNGAPTRVGSTLTVAVNSIALGDREAVVPITVSSDNYATFTVNLTVRTSAKTLLWINIGIVSSRTYDGTRVPYTLYGVADQDSLLPVPYFGPLEVLYESNPAGTYSSATPPRDAGSYSVKVSIPDSDPNYRGDATVSFGIAQRNVAIRAWDVYAKQFDAVPAFTYELSGHDFVAGEGLTAQPQYSTAPALDMAVPGEYAIIPYGADAGPNYVLSYTNGKLTVRALSAACDVIAATSPAGMTVTGTALAANAGYGTGSITVSLAVSQYASWKMYGNEACTAEIASKVMTLAPGPNVAWIKVTAENGTAKVYTLTVTRATQDPKISGPGTVEYRGTITLTVPNEFNRVVIWTGSNSAITVTGNGNSATVTSNRGFIKTGSTRVYAAVGGDDYWFDVKVSPSITQWLMIVLLFGWIWM